MNVFRPVITHY